MARSFLIILFSFCKLSEILETGVAPLTGILLLVVQALVNLTPALFVDKVTHLVMPDVMMLFYGDNATVIVVLQRLPQGAAILHLIVPRHMVEPQQKILRTGRQVVVLASQVSTVLSYSIGTLAAAIEAYALLVSLVVVDGTPLQGIALDETVRFRTVVVVELKDVM